VRELLNDDEYAGLQWHVALSVQPPAVGPCPIAFGETPVHVWRELRRMGCHTTSDARTSGRINSI
jgi:hypothetical protein